jgi:hypothetical protein
MNGNFSLCTQVTEKIRNKNKKGNREARPRCAPHVLWKERFFFIYYYLNRNENYGFFVSKSGYMGGGGWG